MNIGQVLGHELGHTAGLEHPWEIGTGDNGDPFSEYLQRDIFETVQGPSTNTDDQKKKIKQNLENSGANPVKDLKAENRASKRGSLGLTPGQRKAIQYKVEKEQPKSN